MMHSVILFHSNNNAIWTSRVLKKEGIDHKMISVPRHLSSDCGYCVRIKRDDSERVTQLLEKNRIEFEKIADID